MEQLDKAVAERAARCLRRARPLGQQYLRGTEPRSGRHPPIGPRTRQGTSGRRVLSIGLRLGDC